MQCADEFYRVPYADTDQMGVVYYANYLVYFERSRTELFRAAGISYADFEKLGFLLPVREANLAYHASARYDDLLTFRSHVKEAKGARLVIASEVLRDGELLVDGTVTLCCLDASTHRPTRLPAVLTDALGKLDRTENCQTFTQGVK